MIKAFLGAATAAALSWTAGAASAATYSFGMTVGSVGVDGFFEVDDASSGFTDTFDLLDYALTFTAGAESFVGTLANTNFLQTFDITYSADRTTVTAWDFSLGFDSPDGLLQFAGNNISSDFAQVEGPDPFDDGVSPAPTLTSVLQDEPTPAIPLPAALPLLAGALAALGLAARRRG